MNSLLKKLIMAVAVVLSSTGASAAVNLLSMTTDRPLPPSGARQLLGPVLLHNPNMLDTLNVEMTDVQRREGYSVIFAYAGRGNKGVPVEVYVVTLDKRGFFKDGALLGILGDVRSLVIDRNQEMRYEPRTGIDYELTGDTIKVKRTYMFYSTLRGGYPYEKKGTIYNRYVIKEDGTLQQLTPVSTAIESRGSRPAGLPEPRDGKKVPEERTVRTVEGEFDGYGMNVLLMLQTPVSAFDMDHVNSLAKLFDKIDARKKSTDEFNVEMFATWGSALCLRHASVSLPWLATHPDEDLMADCLAGYASEDGVFKAWLKQCVGNLKDKKARKWWQKELKKNDL